MYSDHGPYQRVEGACHVLLRLRQSGVHVNVCAVSAWYLEVESRSED